MGRRHETWWVSHDVCVIVCVSKIQDKIDMLYAISNYKSIHTVCINVYVYVYVFNVSVLISAHASKFWGLVVH